MRSGEKVCAPRMLSVDFICTSAVRTINSDHDNAMAWLEREMSAII